MSENSAYKSTSEQPLLIKRLIGLLKVLASYYARDFALKGCKTISLNLRAEKNC